MEILIKLPNDKKPRIGIAYLSEYQAGKAFEQVIETFPAEVFKARLEIFRAQAHLTLFPLTGGRPVYYKHLSFKSEHIKKLQAFVKPSDEIEFVHIYKKGNEAFVAKVKHRNPNPIILRGYELIT